MKFSPGFDPNSGRITFELECGLLERYFELFETIVNNLNSEVSGVEVERSGISAAKILLPVDLGSTTPGLDSTKIALSMETAKTLNEAVNTFIQQSLKTELQTTEFIPLVDYSWDSMREDIKVAISSKRDFCIIKNYGEFLAMNSKREYKFNQKRVQYGTEEYADVAIMIYRDEQEKMKEIYTSQLVYKDWC